MFFFHTNLTPICAICFADDRHPAAGAADVERTMPWRHWPHHYHCGAAAAAESASVRLNNTLEQRHRPARQTLEPVGKSAPLPNTATSRLPPKAGRGLDGGGQQTRLYRGGDSSARAETRLAWRWAIKGHAGQAPPVISFASNAWLLTPASGGANSH